MCSPTTSVSHVHHGRRVGRDEPGSDYSAAYVVLETSDPAAQRARAHVHARPGTRSASPRSRLSHTTSLGVPVDDLTADLGGLSRRLVTDTQLRWLGPEKGVIHLATAALVNAVWDLYAKLEGKPLWKLLSDLSPDEIVACIDFRYIDDALSPAEAREILRGTGDSADVSVSSRDGFPAYTTSAGWIGYPEETLPQRVHEALAAGFTHLKLKVGGGPAPTSAAPASCERRWGRSIASRSTQTRPGMSARRSPAIKEFAQFDPWWIEEPTSPDDVLAHARIRRRSRRFASQPASTSRTA